MTGGAGDPGDPFDRDPDESRPDDLLPDDLLPDGPLPGRPLPDGALGDGLPADGDGDGPTGPTADLDDETSELVPDSPPLSLHAVETALNRRWPETRIEPTLQRITALLDLLGNPQRAYPVIQVAGTNGKTSVSRMIDALLTAMGLRTGRFTSPHLQKVTERISLDGSPIDDERYVETFGDVAPYVDMVDAASERTGGVPLSKFEILTAMAFAAFADAPVDVAIVEVGIGGTWDSTNVADAAVAVITPIGVDHVDYLGPDLESIAGNKAGIIKAGATAVIGAQEPEAMTVILRRAVQQDATVARFGSEFTVLERDIAVGGQLLTVQGLSGVYREVFLPLHGAHQAGNAAVALAAVEAFLGAGRDRALDERTVQDGFAAVASPGRLERVRTSPSIFVDAAHNPHGATALAAALAEEFSFTRLVGVLAVMADKDVRGILEALADSFDEVVVTVNSSPRSMPVADLAELAEDVFGESRVHTADRMDAAIALAVDLAEDDPENAAGAGVLITGSVVSAGDGRALAGLEPA
ncbi:MAG TPA: folylpolyglutamate synthase/dihydrofolate synthase family protein [Nakamurella sp.]|nr:folylpolyglutamate synthase/dihydrofolate synthase family protein [Nakamurella sp.]